MRKQSTTPQVASRPQNHRSKTCVKAETVTHRTLENYSLPDPPLTPLGLQQCHDLQDHLRHKCPLADQVGLIVSSPMRRTLRTALEGLEWLVQRGVRVEADAMWQENSVEPCDTGSAKAVLVAEFPQLDFSGLDPVYPDKSLRTPYAFTRSANAARGQACLRRLYTRPEKVIAVVSHSGFLRTGISKRRYDYADYRIFGFRRDRGKGGVEVLRLVEDGQTNRGGGGMRRSPRGCFGIEEWDFPPEDGEAEEEEEEGSAGGEGDDEVGDEGGG